jgi:hypothetical protein
MKCKMGNQRTEDREQMAEDSKKLKTGCWEAGKPGGEEARKPGGEEAGKRGSHAEVGMLKYEKGAGRAEGRLLPTYYGLVHNFINTITHKILTAEHAEHAENLQRLAICDLCGLGDLCG